MVFIVHPRWLAADMIRVEQLVSADAYIRGTFKLLRFIQRYTRKKNVWESLAYNIMEMEGEGGKEGVFRNSYGPWRSLACRWFRGYRVDMQWTLQKVSDASEPMTILIHKGITPI